MAYSSGTFSRLFDWTDDRDNGIKIRADRFDQELDGFATGLSTALLKDGTQTATAKIPFAVGLSVIDNQTVLLGTNSDIAIQYDESTNDSLEIAANVEGAALNVVLKADQGDDNADQHKLSISDGGTLTLGSKISGSFVTYLTHTPNATVADSTLAVAGNLTVGGNLTLGSGAVLSEAELEQLDGITAGTVAASKAVVVDANKDIGSFRNITLTGELDAGSLDVSGDADIDGTLEADAMTLNGTAITTTATLSTGVSNGNVLVATSGIADNDFLKVDGTSIEGRSSSEVLSDIGGQAALTFGISNTNIPIFTSGVADDDFLRVNGTAIEGRSASEVLSDIGAISNIVEDSSPQLGGSLDVNGNSIVSASNGNIAITPNGSGKVVIDGISHPTSDGSAGQFLKTDGNGTLAFATVSTPDAFPSGTSMLFQQTAAPTGWTKQTTHNDKSLRLVSGSVGTGGSVAFSTAMATPAVSVGSVTGDPASNLAVGAGNLAVSMSGSISNTTLSINQIPAHAHNFDRAASSNPNERRVVATNNAANANANTLATPITQNKGGSGSHNHGHNLSGSMSGAPSLSGNVTSGNLAVGASTATINLQYVDFIIANKD